jgi:uncharacterized repeat protein (TIGR01451 family)
MKRRILQIVLTTFVLLSFLGSNTHIAIAQGITDISVSMVANQDKVKPGEMITFTVTATNLGPDSAPLIDVIHSLPDQLQFVSLTCDQGVTSDGVFCEYLSLEPGGSVVSTLVATPLIGTDMMRSKQVATTAGVGLETSETVDPNLSNNTATVTTKLNAPKSHH